MQKQYNTIIGNYAIDSVIGDGTSAKVYKVSKLTTNKQYALKIFKQEFYNSNFKEIQNEMAVLSTIKHPNIINLEENGALTIMDNQNRTHQLVYMVTELGSNGLLFDWIISSKGFPEQISRYYFKQIFSAIQYLHSQGIAHRDIKPENIVIDKSFNLKLIDFGFVCKPEENTFYDIAGTLQYISPELFLKIGYKPMISDVFSLGVTLFNLITGIHPFQVATAKDFYYSKIIQKNYKAYWKLTRNMLKHNKNSIGKDCEDLINKMLEYDPKKRIKLEEIVGHEWMGGETATYDEVVEYMEKMKIQMNKMELEEV